MERAYSRRNLGGMLIGFKRVSEAIAHLRKAMDLMPDDPQCIFGLATALEEVGTEEADEETDGLYQRFIEEHPTSPLVKEAEKARTAFGHKRLKSSSVDGFRPDVTMYIAGALQNFQKLGPTKRHEIAVEIAMLGRSGLDINDPTDKYKLKTLPGQFTGLHLLLKFDTSGTQVYDFIGNGFKIADYKTGLARSEGVGSANSSAANSDF